jgi:hypothetical protein
MGSESRKQVYPFQYKANSTVNNYICGGYAANASGVNYPLATTYGLSVPDNILQMTALWTRIIISFDPTEPVANQQILGFSIQPPTYVYTAAPRYSFVPNGSTTLNVQAVGNVIDFSINLQSLLPYIYYFPSSANYAAYFELSVMTPGLTRTATINLWKVDMIYTTQGIR